LTAPRDVISVQRYLSIVILKKVFSEREAPDPRRKATNLHGSSVGEPARAEG